MICCFCKREVKLYDRRKKWGDGKRCGQVAHMQCFINQDVAVKPGAHETHYPQWHRVRDLLQEVGAFWDLDGPYDGQYLRALPFWGTVKVHKVIYQQKVHYFRTLHHIEGFFARKPPFSMKKYHAQKEGSK